jgi:hypothetical protein
MSKKWCEARATLACQNGRRAFAWKNPTPLDRLAAAVFVDSSDQVSQLMALFSAYFDASGNAIDQPHVVVSGFIANYLQWKLFQGEWEDAHRQYGVNLPFHMADFVAACRSAHYKNQRSARGLRSYSG